ncbi:MAG: sigma-70 family RNA polymerase sigma factor [Opitutaceae bacterium]
MADIDKTANEPTNDPESGNRVELFSELLIANRHRIYGFIYSLVHNHQAAEDLMQEVTIVLWRKFHVFEEGTSFAVWAMSVSRFCALNWRRKQARLPLPLDDDELMRMVDESISVGADLSDRHEKLQKCMMKLPAKFRNVLHWRYQKDERVADVSERLGMSVRSVYMFLEKAHALLLECIQGKVKKESELS